MATLIPYLQNLAATADTQQISLQEVNATLTNPIHWQFNLRELEFPFGGKRGAEDQIRDLVPAK